MLKFKKIYNVKNLYLLMIILLSTSGIICGISLSYGYDKEALRLPVLDSSRMQKALILLPPGRIGPFINQRAFPDSISRKIISNMGIEEITEDGKIRIDLSWTGINDSIEFRFIPREEFNQANPLSMDGVYRPFIKQTNKGGSIVYTIPEDITLSELAYLIKDIDAMTNGRAKRLELSNLFSERFKFIAQYLARHIKLEEFYPSERELLKQRVEMLYALGCIFDREPNYVVTQFEDILRKPLPVAEVTEAFEKYLKDDLHLKTDMFTKKEDFLTWFNAAIDFTMQAVHSRVMAQLDFAVFTKGVEEMYQNIQMPYSFSMGVIRWVQSLISQPVDEVLKDKLPLGDWKRRLVNSDPKEEIVIVREIMNIVNKYKAEKHEFSLDWSPAHMRYYNRLNCLGRTILTARILREIGIKEDRIFYAGYPEHAFIILELSDGSYCNVSTYRSSSKYVGRIDSIPKYYIRNNIVTGGSIFYDLGKPLYASMPKTQFVNVASYAEGIMSDVYESLAVSIGNQIKGDFHGELPYEEQLRIRDIQIACIEKSMELNSNNQLAYYELGLCYIAKSKLLQRKDPRDEEAIKFVNKAIAAFNTSVKLTRNYPQRYYALGEALLERSQFELDPESAKQFRMAAMSAFRKALSLDPNYKLATSGLAIGVLMQNAVRYDSIDASI